jgi:3-oxoadipate enol-lactonase
MEPGAAIAVHAECDGPEDAPVVVLSNSLGATLEMWDRNAAALAARFRVVRYDLRGHGRSPVPDGPSRIADLGGDLVALLDRLGVERASLVGVSLGGMVSLWTAIHHAGRVGALVPCFTAAALGPPEAWAARAAMVLADGAGAVAAAVVGRWFTPAFAAREPEVVEGFRSGIAATSAAGYASCCHAIETLDLRADLGAIRAPTLVVAGADDPSTPAEHGRLIAGAVPGARLVVLRGAAHLGNVERADEFNRLVIDFLARPDPRRAPPGTRSGAG